MTKPNLSTLADRVEAGTEPIAKLLAEAFKALHPKPQNIWANKARTEWTAEYDAYHILSWQFSHLLEARGFTDAAMLLVPEGWAVEALSFWPESPEDATERTAAQANCRLVGTSLKRFGRKMVWGHGSGDGRTEGNATERALALAAASIRAHAAKEPTL